MALSNYANIRIDGLLEDWMNRMNWLLIIVCVVILGNAFRGMKVGFIRTVFSLVSMILAVILTLWISPVMKDFLTSNEKFYDGLTKNIEKMIPFSTDEVVEKEQDNMIDEMKLPKSLKQSLKENNTLEKQKELAANSFREYISRYLTEIIINALSFILTFIIISALLWILCLALDIISKLPLIHSVNKTTGLLAGLVQGLFEVWLFFILLTVFGSTAFGQKIMEMIGESEILSLLYNNNILLRFITGATKLIF